MACGGPGSVACPAPCQRSSGLACVGVLQIWWVGRGWRGRGRGRWGGAERSWLLESQAGRTRGWRRGCTLVLVVRGAASAVDAEALLQESRSPGVLSTFSKAPVLCSPRSSSRWPRARTPRAAAATAAAAARAAVARAPVAAVAAVAPGLGEVRVLAGQAMAAGGSRVGAAGLVWSSVRRSSPSLGGSCVRRARPRSPGGEAEEQNRPEGDP